MSHLHTDRRDLGEEFDRPRRAGEVHADPDQGLLRQALEAHHQHSPQVRDCVDTRHQRPP